MRSFFVICLEAKPFKISISSSLSLSSSRGGFRQVQKVRITGVKEFRFLKQSININYQIPDYKKISTFSCKIKKISPKIELLVASTLPIYVFQANSQKVCDVPPPFPNLSHFVCLIMKRKSAPH